MKSDELKQLLNASPFHAITICLGSSKTYKIPHPEFAALSPDGSTLVVFLTEGRGLDVLDVRQIKRVEVRRRSATRS